MSSGIEYSGRSDVYVAPFNAYERIASWFRIQQYLGEAESNKACRPGVLEAYIPIKIVRNVKV